MPDTSLRIHIISGHHPDPVNQDYNYRRRTTDVLDRCLQGRREASIAALVARAINVSANEHSLTADPSIKGGWKKLKAIELAARNSDIVVWHDADALPARHSTLIRHIRQIAALQPTVGLWLAPGPRLLQQRSLLSAWRSLAGLPLSEARALVQDSNSLQTGVLVVRPLRIPVSLLVSHFSLLTPHSSFLPSHSQCAPRKSHITRILKT